jgi:predicted patatin/cPLA2 family phospholipase
MRGVISGGALLAMEELGLTEAFDEVYAESAGAINASYFLAGQGSLGSRIYFEDIASARFINPLRVRRVLDLDYLIDEVMVKTKPLDAERVVRSRSRLLVSLTNAADGGRKVVDVRATRQPLLRILKATAAVIPLYNRAVELADGSYVDGGIADPIPVRNAIANGCTHILVLLTQPVGYRDRKFRGPTWLAARLLLGRKWDPRLVRSLFREKYRRYNASRDLALGYARAERSASIAVICPDGHSLGVARLTRDAERLRSALLTSKEHALKVFRGAG